MKVHALIEDTNIEDDVHNHAITDIGLYRGLTQAIDSITKLPIRTDRKPRTSSAAQNILFDMCFMERFGVESVRRKALFCTTSVDTANEYAFGGSGYGCIVEVFPLKGSKMAYNLQIGDSWELCEDLQNSFAAGDEDAEYFVNLLDETPGNTSSEAFNLALNQIEESKREALVQRLKDISQKTMSQYVVGSVQQLRNADNVEVMIFDAPAYYASPVDDYDGDGF